MAIASGLGGTLGFAAEDTVGDYQTPTRFLNFTKESLAEKKNIVQGADLHGGLYELAARRRAVTYEPAGDISMELYDRSIGLLLGACIGGFPTPTELGTTGAYTATFTPGDLTGNSLTIQVGRPATSGTIEPFSYTGNKVTAWTIGITNTGLATLDLTFDGIKELTSESYVAPSYIPSNVFAFTDATLLAGGTVTTTDGVASVTGAAAFTAVVSAATIKGTNALDTSRFGLGNAGYKSEQLPNGFRALSGSLTMDLANLTDVYTAFQNDTSMALQLNFVSPYEIYTGATPTYSSFSVLIPSIFIDSAPPEISGPDVISVSAAFTGLDDGVNPQIQFQTTSLDQAL